mmetsp:Transcript_87881/g.246820  ORF Transcript_87881/g.246820 Transcript_87881/m.246820 type:complete len:635 (-) Transcript_87881:70-1974(-)
MVHLAEEETLASAHGGELPRQSLPWNGVNLGGWLLLEPGPASELFKRHPRPGSQDPWSCEWDLMKALRKEQALHELTTHRETFLHRSDFEQIQAAGLNAVRLPFGYWVVLGPCAGEAYEGPALQYIDRAVDWAEELGLQVVLDLHGAPGGESGDPPSGRRHRSWHWTQWRFDDSLRALEVVARRYCMRKAVTGIEVCNEPSNSVPLDKLLGFYDRAVDTVRGAGMHPRDVAVVLPVFQRPLADVANAWAAMTGGRHANICFDLHYYHCFGNAWHGMSLAKSLRAIERADELRSFPAVVGEWSLGLGRAASQTETWSESEVRAVFGRAQAAAYKQASHGMFFWSYRDANGVEWDWQRCHREGALSGPPLPLPPWDKTGEDPVEEWFDPSPAEPHVRFGDVVYLRTYRGEYVDVNEGSARVQYEWQDDSCKFTVYPLVGNPCRTQDEAGRIGNGTSVRLKAQNGRFLAVASGASTVCAACPEEACGTSAVFTVHLDAGDSLKHRGVVFLRSRATGCVLDIDGGDNSADVSLRATRDDFGAWGRFVVQKERAKLPVQPACQDVAIVLAPETPPSRRCQTQRSKSPVKRKAKRLGSPKLSPRRPWARPSKRRSLASIVVALARKRCLAHPILEAAVGA